MIPPRVEDVLLAYVAAFFQATGDVLAGVAILPGHRAADIDQSQTGTPWIVCTAELAESPLLADCGIYTVDIHWKLLAPATPEGQLNLTARSQEILNIFADDRLDTIAAWINDTQTAVNVACNALRYVRSSDGKVPDREQVGAQHTWQGEFLIPADEVLETT